MSVVDDVLKVLDRIPIWKRLSSVPGEVDDLRARVVQLEEKLGGKWPADVCKFCGERAVRLHRTFPANKGAVSQLWRCEKCEKVETRLS